MPRVFSTCFVYDFSRGDNLVWNVEVLEVLWRLREEADQKNRRHLAKPLLVQISSIIELCLCEIFHRGRYHTREGIPTLTHKQIRGIQITTKDDFSMYIKICRQNSILGKPSHSIYGDLDRIRTFRNRIHIQNLDNELPKSEQDIYNEDLIRKAEECLEYILVYLNERYPRAHTYTADINLPWDHEVVI